MYKHKEAIDYIYNILQSKDGYFCNHKNLVIHGNNSSGKSSLLREILGKSVKRQKSKIYFVDAKNRNVYDTNNAYAGGFASKFTISDIVKCRMSDGFFSIKDAFSFECTGGEVIFREILDDLASSEKPFTNKVFQHFSMKMERVGAVIPYGPMEEVNVNGHNIKSISTSEAAKIRLLFEVEYAQKLGANVVIIDEFDEFLSDSTAEKLIDLFLKEYPKMRFVFVVQSLNVIIRLKDLDLALIVEDNGRSALNNQVDFVDGDYIDGLAKVSRIRDMLEDGKYVEKSDLERLVDALITDKVTPKDALKKVDALQRDSLSPKDKILYDYAKRYVENDS